MILVIHGTNRITSQSKPVSDFVVNYLVSKFPDSIQLIDLSTIPMTAFASEIMYHTDTISDEIKKLQLEYLIPAEKFIFVSPEYNGSIPGILKLFIDACSISDARASFYHKKALLIGVASGRAGNLRGLDHLAAVLMYVNMVIYPNKLPISRIESLMDFNQNLTDESTIKVISKLIDEFLEF